MAKTIQEPLDLWEVIIEAIAEYEVAKSSNGLDLEAAKRQVRGRSSKLGVDETIPGGVRAVYQDRIIGFAWPTDHHETSEEVMARIKGARQSSLGSGVVEGAYWCLFSLPAKVIGHLDGATSNYRPWV